MMKPTVTPKRILLAEDDHDFSHILRQYLELHGFVVTPAADGKEAIKCFEQRGFDLCILDVMMPQANGFTVAEVIRRINPEVPFIFLTARKMKADRIKGLRLGADDYISKPFEADELVLRLKNILRRSGGKGPEEQLSRGVSIGSYQFFPDRLELSLAEQTRSLTKKEAELIDFLQAHRNTLLRRQVLLQELWGDDDFFSGRSMDVFISRLRKYFQEDERISLKSTRGVGLEFRVPI
ncbi:MAG: response regulator transcription factor [Bacteroidota bacterium]